ncbi:hypothetical protein DIC66_07925 [Rhodoferax lacus]|uniref:Lipoprotein n=1 Tax=Rhodoferax lacus TaxID=2184758 RepID=A0A3E1RER0_9BURK|nr:hypothetical protein [Rhodoferax lacus]RFO97763.1 hypothetical protein DIC66_07925 [Rhodoferax lacus]
MKHHVIRTTRLFCLLGLLLAACAQLPAAIKDLNWKDRWGDRGEQVLSRDYAMCQELVEQRRSLLSSCMAARGWYWDEAL